jgi:hypothetical protein
LCDDYECGRSSGEKEEVDKCDPELVWNFTKAHAPYLMVKSFFYTDSIGKQNKQNTTNLGLFDLKCKVSTISCQLQISLGGGGGAAKWFADRYWSNFLFVHYFCRPKSNM